MTDAHALLESALGPAPSPFGARALALLLDVECAAAPHAPYLRKRTSSSGSARRSHAPMDVDLVSVSDTSFLRAHDRRSLQRRDDDASSDASDSSFVFEPRPATPSQLEDSDEEQRPRKLLESYARASVVLSSC